MPKAEPKEPKAASDDTARLFAAMNVAPPKQPQQHAPVPVPQGVPAPHPMQMPMFVPPQFAQMYAQAPQQHDSKQAQSLLQMLKK